jgi:hypothetical protein
MELKLRRKPKGSYEPSKEFEGWTEVGIGAIFVEFRTDNPQNNSRFEIKIDDFEALALEMIEADPEKAIKAFSTATIKAFTAASNVTTSTVAA